MTTEKGCYSKKHRSLTGGEN